MCLLSLACVGGRWIEDSRDEYTEERLAAMNDTMKLYRCANQDTSFSECLTLRRVPYGQVVGTSLGWGVYCWVVEILRLVASGQFVVSRGRKYEHPPQALPVRPSFPKRSHVRSG